MFILIRPHVTTLVLLVGLLFSRVVHAAPTDDQAQAAVLFDQGVHEFALRNYESAARFFLSADALQPSLDALNNAFTAALKSGQDLLIAPAARRVLERPEATAQSHRKAQKALATAEPKLARVDAICTPAPCSLLIDGKSADTGVSYVSAGMHELSATSERGARVAQELSCEAGALCAVRLELTESEPVVAVVAPREEPVPAESATVEAEDQAEPDGAAAPVLDRAVPSRRESWARRERAPLAVLIGLGATAVTLGGVTVWSGMQALSARDEYKTSPRTYDPSEVHRLARRTDILLSGALVFAAAASATALWWVDWRSAGTTTVALVPSRGLMVLGETRF